MSNKSIENIGVIINLNSNYSNFQFNLFTVPVFLSILPFFYIIPTICVLFRIIHIYIEKGVRKNEEIVNKSVFLVIILSQVSCLCFFLSDFVVIRLPSTGILTSWCQKQSPNHLLSLIFTSQVYFGYVLMIYPVLLTVARLVPIHYPHKHREINSKIMKFSIPFIHIYPFIFIFFMLPAYGVCRQFMSPYPFGSAFIHFFGSWNEMTNMPFEIINTLFWLIVYLLTNYRLHKELRKLKLTSQCHLHMNQSAKYRKAEFSLTITTGLMILSYIVNLVFQGTFLIDFRLGTYTSFLRPYGNDLETCVVPWVFYMTHPAFQKKQGSTISSSGQQRTTIT